MDGGAGQGMHSGRQVTIQVLATVDVLVKQLKGADTLPSAHHGCVGQLMHTSNRGCAGHVAIWPAWTCWSKKALEQDVLPCAHHCSA
jgi:hypothetical protein